MSLGGPPAGVVFDCDGVLADTTPAWEEAFRSVAHSLKVPLSARQLRALHGSDIGAAADWFAERTATTAVCIAEMLRSCLTQQVERRPLLPVPGLRQLLHVLHGYVPLAVASNGPKLVLEQVLSRLRLAGVFEVVLSADDVAAPKPAPDPYLAACAGLGALPSRCLAIEDSAIGSASAHAAGLGVIELASPGQRSPARRSNHALLVVETLKTRRSCRPSSTFLPECSVPGLAQTESDD